MENNSFQILLPDAEFSIEVSCKSNRVLKAPTVVGWMKGKHVEEVLKWCKRNKAVMNQKQEG